MDVTVENVYRKKIKTCVPKNEIEKNLKLVIMFANQLCRKLGYNTYRNDMIQVGNMGLMKAVEKFNPDRGVKFSYYACPWILEYMHKEIYRIMHSASVPLSKQTYDKSGIDAEYYSMDYIKSGSDINPTESSMHFASKENIEDKIIVQDFREKFDKQMVRLLTERELKIMRLRYLNNYSFEDIGQETGLTKQRIQQIDLIIKEKLKKSEDMKNLYYYCKEIIS